MTLKEEIVEYVRAKGNVSFNEFIYNEAFMHRPMNILDEAISELIDENKITEYYSIDGVKTLKLGMSQ